MPHYVVSEPEGHCLHVLRKLPAFREIPLYLPVRIEIHERAVYELDQASGNRIVRQYRHQTDRGSVLTVDERSSTVLRIQGEHPDDNGGKNTQQSEQYLFFHFVTPVLVITQILFDQCLATSFLLVRIDGLHRILQLLSPQISHLFHQRIQVFQLFIVAMYRMATGHIIHGLSSLSAESASNVIFSQLVAGLGKDLVRLTHFDQFAQMKIGGR